MKKIKITNSCFYDKDYWKTFALGDKYKFISVKSESLLALYQNLLKEVIDEKVNQTVKDLALSKEETSQIKQIFERELEEALTKREELKENTPYHKIITWKEEKYPISLSLTKPNHRLAYDFYSIIQICEECLNEDKPVFLSIE